MLNTALAFIKKDFLIMVSYRFNFILQIAYIFVAVTIFYFIGKFIDANSNPFFQNYGGSYFGFLLIGITFGDYTKVSINSFANNIRDGQLTGTLEIILASPTRFLTFLLSSSLWSYIFTSIRILLYLFTGIFFFGLSMEHLNFVPAVVIFAISILCYTALGMICSALVLLVKKGDTAINTVGAMSMIVSGILFPTDIFPSLLKTISNLIPFTYSLHGLRLSILNGASFEAVKTDIWALLVFTVIFWAISIWSFPYAVRRAKIKGTLTQY